ncbi:unnamed protein product, partial [Closterium sp. NIES-54]
MCATAVPAEHPALLGAAHAALQQAQLQGAAHPAQQVLLPLLLVAEATEGSANPHCDFCRSSAFPTFRHMPFSPSLYLSPTSCATRSRFGKARNHLLSSSNSSLLRPFLPAGSSLVQTQVLATTASNISPHGMRSTTSTSNPHPSSHHNQHQHHHTSITAVACRSQSLASPTHLLHGVIHTNGFGHLVTLNGRAAGSHSTQNYFPCDTPPLHNSFNGSSFPTSDIFRECRHTLHSLSHHSSLPLPGPCLPPPCSLPLPGRHDRVVSVEDLSHKLSFSSDYRLLHTLAFSHSWFARWSYSFVHGAFGITQQRYNRAVARVAGTRLLPLLQHLRGINTGISSRVAAVVAKYQSHVLSAKCQPQGEYQPHVSHGAEEVDDPHTHASHVPHAPHGPHGPHAAPPNLTLQHLFSSLLALRSSLPLPLHHQHHHFPHLLHPSSLPLPFTPSTPAPPTAPSTPAAAAAPLAAVPSLASSRSPLLSFSARRLLAPPPPLTLPPLFPPLQPMAARQLSGEPSPTSASCLSDELSPRQQQQRLLRQQQQQALPSPVPPISYQQMDVPPSPNVPTPSTITSGTVTPSAFTPRSKRTLLFLDSPISSALAGSAAGATPATPVTPAPAPAAAAAAGDYSRRLLCKEPIIISPLPADSPSCRWSSKRLHLAQQVIVDVLSLRPGAWLPRHEVREAARQRIGDTGLLDFVLKSLGNRLVGDVVGGERGGGGRGEGREGVEREGVVGEEGRGGMEGQQGEVPMGVVSSLTLGGAVDSGGDQRRSFEPVFRSSCLGSNRHSDDMVAGTAAEAGARAGAAAAAAALAAAGAVAAAAALSPAVLTAAPFTRADVTRDVEFLYKHLLFTVTSAHGHCHPHQRMHQQQRQQRRQQQQQQQQQEEGQRETKADTTSSEFSLSAFSEAVQTILDTKQFFKDYKGELTREQAARAAAAAAGGEGGEDGEERDGVSTESEEEDGTIRVLCSIDARDADTNRNWPIPPPELITLPPEATVADLKAAACRAFAQTYPVARHMQ